MFHSTRKCSLIKDVKIHSAGYVRQSPGTVCKLSARTVASVDVPIRKLPLLILGLKGLLGKVHNNLLSPSGRPTLSVPAIYACICHQIITILHRNRVSSQIYEQPLGLLRWHALGWDKIFQTYLINQLNYGPDRLDCPRLVALVAALGKQVVSWGLPCTSLSSASSFSRIVFLSWFPGALSHELPSAHEGMISTIEFVTGKKF